MVISIKIEVIDNYILLICKSKQYKNANIASVCISRKLDLSVAHHSKKE